jgi:beta-glucosidase-like glycosyl hydrolase
MRRNFQYEESGQRKKSYLFSDALPQEEKILMAITTPILIAMGVAMGVGDSIAKQYENNIDSFLTAQKADAESILEQREKGNALSQQIVREGATLVKNDNNTLPLKKTIKKVNVFAKGNHTIKFEVPSDLGDGVGDCNFGGISFDATGEISIATAD